MRSSIVLLTSEPLHLAPVPSTMSQCRFTRPKPGSPTRFQQHERVTKVAAHGGAAPCHNNTISTKLTDAKGTHRATSTRMLLSTKESQKEEKISITIITQLTLDKNPCITSELLKSLPKVDLAKSSRMTNNLGFCKIECCLQLPTSRLNLL